MNRFGISAYISVYSRELKSFLQVHITKHSHESVQVNV